MYVDDFGYERESKDTYLNTELDCPEGKRVSQLIRTGGEGIRYTLPGWGSTWRTWSTGRHVRELQRTVPV